MRRLSENQLNIFEEINNKELSKKVLSDVYYNELGEPLPWEEDQAKLQKTEEKYIGIELNPDYIKIANQRLAQEVLF